jgi:CRP-like cAMP-binding protein
MWTEQFGPRDVVIEQGELSKNFYIVRRGEVEVVRQAEGQERRLAILGDGDCFGEEALLRDQPRNATVRATQPTLLYVLGEKDFRAALAASESLREELQKVLFERQ